MRSIQGALALVVAFGSALPSPADPPKKTATPAAKTESEKKVPCEEHGVKKTICTRCNPKLAAVYKSKGDWCQEHDRAESQCAICNPELKKKGVKP